MDVSIMSAVKNFFGLYRFLSNFWPCEIDYEGIVYPTTEHAFQAAKSLDVEVRERISKLMTPGIAKKAGRAISIRPDWEDVKIQVMKDITRIKFQYPSLAKRLIATYPMELQEGNTWGDKFWGVDLESGVGENHLGKILMEVRAELCADAAWDSYRKLNVKT